MKENYFKKYPNKDGFFNDYGGAFIPPNLEEEMKKMNDGSVEPKSSLNSINSALIKNLSVEKGITIIAGAPLVMEAQLFIGAFIINADSTVQVYTKQFLHDGEEVVYMPNNKWNPIIEIDGQKCSIAICADITDPSHPNNAKQNKVSIYLASLFYTKSGIEKGCASLLHYAATYNMHILMANFVGTSYGFESGGKTSFWNNSGELVKQLDDKSDRLLLIDLNDL